MTVTQIKAIETHYNGYRFRSRLEARWAVFFGMLDIEYEYEKEGYDLDGMWYLPDFWLPDMQCFIEIKGIMPKFTGLLSGNDEDAEKALALAATSKYPVYIFAGSNFFPLHIDDDMNLHGMSAIGCYWQDVTSDRRNRFRTRWDVSYSAPNVFIQCPQCERISIVHNFDIRLPCCFGDEELMPIHNGNNLRESARLIAAYTAARQARFEHGERPKSTKRETNWGMIEREAPHLDEVFPPDYMDIPEPVEGNQHA